MSSENNTINTGVNYKLPRLFGKYYLLELINVGGMAEVFRAKMFGVEGFEKIVAIKKILPEVAEDAEFIRMFIDEAKIAVQLSHPNIVQILELGKIDDAFFIAMELVHGKDLKTIRKRLKKVELLMSVEQCAYIVSQVCDGLDYAHRKTNDKMQPINIVHRDISPQNMIVSYEGNVKLIDFGIAKAKSKSTKTQAGMLKGKFSYMSPEQVTGQPIDRRSDIFSLGVVLYEMLTGKRLFLGKNDVETLEKIRKAEVPPPSVFNSKITEEMDRIVLKALAKDRDERYQWASDFGEDLKRFIFSTNVKFDRQDMMAFMAEFFADEIEEDSEKLEKFNKLEIPKSMTSGHHTNHGSDSPENIEPSVKKKKGSFILKALLTLLFIGIVAAGSYFLIPIIQGQNELAKLLIDSTVPQTLVNVDEGSMSHKRCETPCAPIDLLPGEHIIKLSKQGYITHEETIVITKGKSTSKVVKMFKIGELKTIVTVKSDPEGAKIFIDDQDSHETTPAVLNVPVGVDITVRIEREGFLPVEQNIGKLAANTSRELSFVMKTMRGAAPQKERKEAVNPTPRGGDRPQPKKEVKSLSKEDSGTLSINSKPWTNVYIDGVFIKATPIFNYSVSAGDHKVKFVNQKFNIDKTFPVSVQAKENVKVIKEF